MEKRSYTATGKTVDEALENAKKGLGIETIDGFNFEILEYDKKGFLGIGSKPAKVRVYEEGEDEDTRADLHGEQRDLRLPALSEGDVVQAADILPQRHITFAGEAHVIPRSKGSGITLLIHKGFCLSIPGERLALKGESLSPGHTAPHGADDESSQAAQK